MKRTVTEYVEFKTVEGTEDSTFVQIVDKLEEGFHRTKPGFISTELCKAGEGHWVMIQHWETMEDAKAVVRQMMQDPGTEDFRAVLDPSTVKMKLMEQHRTW